MNEKQIISKLYAKLNNESLGFTTKHDPTLGIASHYYRLDDYGDLTENSIKEIIKELNSYIGDGAVDIDDAIDIWIQEALFDNRIAYDDILVTKFKDKPVIDQIDAYESQVLRENNLLTEHTESWLKSVDIESHWVKPFVDYFMQEHPNEKINKILLEVVEGGWQPCVAFIETDNNTYRVFIGKLNDGLYMSDTNSIKLAKSNFKSEYDSVEESKKITEEFWEDGEKYEYKGIVIQQSISDRGKKLYSILNHQEPFSIPNFTSLKAAKQYIDENNLKSYKLQFENYQRRLREENNKSANAISDMFTSNDFDSDSKQGKIVMRTSEVFNALSDKGYDVQVNFDNGESTSSILLGQQGGQVIITITDAAQPLRAFASGNFEVTTDTIDVLQDIQNQISAL